MAWEHYFDARVQSLQLDAVATDWSAICFPELKEERENFPKSEEIACDVCDIDYRRFPKIGDDDTFHASRNQSVRLLSKATSSESAEPRKGRGPNSGFSSQPSYASQTSPPPASYESPLATAELSRAGAAVVSGFDPVSADASSTWIQIEESLARARSRIAALDSRDSRLLAQFDEIGRELDRLEHQKVLREQAASREETKTRRRAYADILGKLTRALGSVSQDDAGWMELTQELQELGIEPIGRVGDSVELAPGYEKQYDLGARTELAPGASVEVLSNGWSWEDQTLVRARVRPVRGGTP